MISRRLAIRALNEARRSDPLAYLSLRHTVNTVVGLKDQWAREIATSIVMGRGDSTFVKSLQFKEVSLTGKPEFRTVRFGGGPHQLAEVALLEACSLAGPAFRSANSVYSYKFANRISTEGVFRPYFDLFSQRQTDIGKRCRKYARHLVVYLDIKKFYPSVKVTRVRKAWNRACKSSRINSNWTDLGNYLIDLQYAQRDGLLVGPQFSHLLANLLLRDFDAAMEKHFPNLYFRYVDDFAVLVRPEEKNRLISFVRSHLKRLGLILNEDKTHWMGAEKWGKNAPFQIPDYVEEHVADEDWMHFIDHLKRYLVANPSDGPKIQRAFESENIRVPVPRYEVAIQEEIYQIGFQRRRERKGFDGETVGLTITGMVRHALALRKRYIKEFSAAWPDFQSSTGLFRKWKRSRIRYLIGRCLLVASEHDLSLLLQAVASEPEFADYAAMLEVIVKRDPDPLLRFGWKPAFAMAPTLQFLPLLQSKRQRWSQESIEALTALRLGGAKVEANVSASAMKENRYHVSMAQTPHGSWITEKDLFYRELMCLNSGIDHQTLREAFLTPLDPDENWTAFSEELLGMNPT